MLIDNCGLFMFITFVTCQVTFIGEGDFTNTTFETQLLFFKSWPMFANFFVNLKLWKVRKCSSTKRTFKVVCFATWFMSPKTQGKNRKRKVLKKLHFLAWEYSKRPTATQTLVPKLVKDLGRHTDTHIQTCPHFTCLLLYLKLILRYHSCMTSFH